MPTLENHWLRAWIEIFSLLQVEGHRLPITKIPPLRTLALTPTIQYPHIVMEGQAWARESLVT